MLLLLGCEERPAADPVGSTPRAVVEAVLERCHGPLRGGMDRVQLELRAPDGTTSKIQLWLPDRMRVESDETIDTLVADRAWRIFKSGPTSGSTDLQGDELAALTRLKDQLRGLLLSPLYEALSVSHDGAVFVLQLAEGERWELQLGADSLPSRLQGPAGEIRFAEYLITSRTRIPRRVVIDGLGEREVAFRAQDISFLPAVFARPESRVGASALRVVPGATGLLTLGREHRPATPEVTDVGASSWLIMADPGTWRERHEIARTGQRTLLDQGQILKGFTGFVEEDPEPLMMIPFAPDPGRGDPRFEPGERRVRRVPAHRALVVYPTTGPFAEKVAEGFIALRQFAAANALQATGPVRVYPYLPLADRAPTADDLTSVTVRLELPIR